MIRYSKSTHGFYPYDIHYAHLPSDIIDISMDEFNIAMSKDSSESFEVINGRVRLIPPKPSEAYTWDTKTQQYIFDEDKQAEIDEKAKQDAIPKQVTMAQAQLVLYKIGVLDDIEAFMANPDTPREYKIYWNKAQVVERANPIVGIMQGLLSLTTEQIDNLFIEAAKI